MILVTPDGVSQAAVRQAVLRRLFAPAARMATSWAQTGSTSTPVPDWNASNSDQCGPGLGAVLLGVKRLQWLPTWAAAEVCPYPKGHALHDQMVEALAGGPVLALAVRLVDGISRIQAMLGPLPPDLLVRAAPARPAADDHDADAGRPSVRHLFAVDAVSCAVLSSQSPGLAFRQVHTHTTRAQPHSSYEAHAQLNEA